MSFNFSFFSSKKGNAFSQLSAIGISIATLAIVLTVTFLIMSQGKTQIEDIEGLNSTGGRTDGSGYTSLAWNATSTLQAAVDDIPGWVPLIVITMIGLVLLGLVVLFSKFKGGF